MELRQKILKLLGDAEYIPLRAEEICVVLKLDQDETKKALGLLKSMLEHGQIAQLKKDRLCITQDADLVSGRILFRQNGAATLIPDTNPSSPTSDGYPVAAQDTGVALHGDSVLARINERGGRRFRGKSRLKRTGQDPKQKPAVRVIRILKRAHETIVGTLDKGRHTHYVIPDDPRIIQDFRMYYLLI
ncbi:MAG: hypothetical protein AAGC73_07995 [Verrucomicrobiota bacterium]